MAIDTSSPRPAIGVFDSGVGGLSVLRELVQHLPQARFVYVADSAHCPYGGKSAGAITARAMAITDFLIGRGAEQIVVACNTATIAAIEALRASHALNFVGMEPAVKPAVAATRSGVVGVLATGAALAGSKLLKLIDAHAGAVRIITQPCPGLVERVEAGDLDGPSTRALLARHVQPLLAAGADTLVLGCTHYPFLRPVIAELAGSGVTLLDTGAAVARRSASLLGIDTASPVPPDEPARIDWYAGGDLVHFAAVGSRLWGSAIVPQAFG